MNGMAPTYISELLHIYKPARPLRSAYQNLLVIPRSNTATYGERAFSIYVPQNCGIPFQPPSEARKVLVALSPN